MYFRKEKYWLCYPHDILAINYQEAAYIAKFLRIVQMNRTYYDSFEIIDIRKYRLVKKRKQVAAMLKLAPFEQYFLFPVNKN